ncbi:MAG: FAD-dependent oxidoreductase, partial [Clostridia bacterium]|nr:FAD-dependent oxidoreductase [Clostridia bacterium]
MDRKTYDVIVVGAGPGGIPAAIAASRMGMSVLLADRNAQLGGLLVSGLPLLAFLDRSGNQVIGGIAQEIVDRLHEVGGVNDHIRSPILNSMTHVNPAWMRIVISEMCRECKNMDILLYAELANVALDNGRVTGVDLFCRGDMLHYDGKIVIDATCDACVVYKSGARYEKGEHLQPMSLTFDLIDIDYDKVFEFLETHPEEVTLPETFKDIKHDLNFLRDNSCSSFMGFMHMVKEGKREGTFTLDRNMIDFCRQIDGNAFINTTRVVNADSTDAMSIINAEFEGLEQIKELTSFMKKHIPGFE